MSKDSLGLTRDVCLEIEDKTAIYSPLVHDGRLTARLVPRWENPGFASKIRLHSTTKHDPDTLTQVTTGLPASFKAVSQLGGVFSTHIYTYRSARHNSTPLTLCGRSQRKRDPRKVNRANEYNSNSLNDILLRLPPPPPTPPPLSLEVATPEKQRIRSTLPSTFRKARLTSGS